MIILDTNILIGHFDAKDAHHTAATALLDRHADHPFGANVLTVGETLVRYARHGHSERALSALRKLGLTILDMPASAALTIAALRAETGLRMPDCCVLYAAQECGADIATFDERLAHSARDLGFTVRS